MKRFVRPARKLAALADYCERVLERVPHDLSRGHALGGLVLCSVFAAWMTSGLWGEGLPAGDDMARHYWRARVMNELFFPSGHLDGWSPYWHLGLQQFLFQSYGYYLAMALVDHIAGGTLEFLTVFKLALVGPFLVLPWVVYALARAVDVRRWAALAGAYVVLGVGVHTGFGVKGWYDTGLILQAPGVLLIGLSLIAGLRGVRDGGVALPLTALLTGIALVTHLISGAYLLAAVTLYGCALAPQRRSVAPLARTGVVVALALGLAAHSLFRTLELRDLMGGVVGWGKDGPIDRILAGNYFASPLLSLIGYVGAAAALVWHRQGRFPVACLFVGTTLFASSSHIALPFDFLTKVADTVFRPRSLPAACLLFPVFVGYGLEVTAAGIMRLAPVLPSMLRRPRIAVTFLIVAVSVLSLERAVGLASVPRTIRPANAPAALPYQRVIEYLREHGKAHDVVAFEMRIFDARESGSRRFASLLNDQTGLYALGGDQAEATNARHHHRITADRIAGSRPASFARALRRLSVSWLLVRSPRASARLRDTPGVDLELRAGAVELYRVRGRRHFAGGRGLAARLQSFEPERIRWDIDNRRQRVTRAELAVSRHPNWRGFLDGEPTQLQGSGDRLLTATIPPGRHELEIRWIRPFRQSAYDLISLAAVAAIVWGMLASWRGPARRGSALDFSEPHAAR